MRNLKFTLVSLMLVCAGFMVLACAEKQLNEAKDAYTALAATEDAAAIDAAKAGNSAEAASHTAAAKAARDRAAQLEAQRAAAQAADNNSWSGGIGSASSLANLLFPGLGVVVGALGTLITQKVRGTSYAAGQADGAATATTAITNADTSNSLQDPRVKTEINAQLSTAPPHITNAVNAAI